MAESAGGPLIPTHKSVCPIHHAVASRDEWVQLNRQPAFAPLAPPRHPTPTTRILQKMSETEHAAPHVHEKNYHPPKPYWRRAHTDWKFWVAVFFVFAALAIYILSYDLVLIPRSH